jgi:hypothetical protein
VGPLDECFPLIFRYAKAVVIHLFPSNPSMTMLKLWNNVPELGVVEVLRNDLPSCQSQQSAPTSAPPTQCSLWNMTLTCGWTSTELIISKNLVSVLVTRNSIGTRFPVLFRCGTGIGPEILKNQTCIRSDCQNWNWISFYFM